MKVSLRTKHWIARVMVLLVFCSNMYCAYVFFAHPTQYIDAYQLAGPGATSAISGMAVLFCMWNVAYLPTIVAPHKHRAIFLVVIAQQVVGLVGEVMIYAGLNSSQAILAASIMRFIIFDAGGFILLLIGFILSRSNTDA